LSESETTHAVDAIEKLAKFDWIGKRDVAIMLLLYGCGLRISEAPWLRCCDIPEVPSQDVETPRIKGKGG
jgi:integrase/recombinase XerC